MTTPYKIYSDRSKTVTLILCIFLGEFGIHEFYLGRFGLGLIKLITGNFFGIGWFVDVILILLGKAKDEFGLPVWSNNTKRRWDAR